MICPLDFLKCRSNLAILAFNEKNSIQTYPIYGSSVCFWNISTDQRNYSESLFIQIDEVANGDVSIMINSIKSKETGYLVPSSKEVIRIQSLYNYTRV